MRQSPGSFRWTATWALIALLIVAFFIQYGALSRQFWNEYLALSLGGIERGFVWQLLTFQFLHGGLLHLLGNCVGLYFFGREVESILGKQRFLVLYFSGGAIGGLLQVLLSWVWPVHFGGGVLGASAGIFAIIATFSTILPDQLISLLFLPMIRFRARTLLIVSTAIAALGVAFPSLMGNDVAHAAHLGGILVGIGWVKLGWHRDYIQLPWEGWLSGRRLFPSRQRRPSRTTPIKFPSLSALKSDEPTEVPQEEFISREVDPILDKISQHGIQSLTERERKILEAARNKMAKR